MYFPAIFVTYRRPPRVSLVIHSRSASAQHSQVAEAAIAASLHTAAERIERLTKTLNQSLREGAALG